MATRFYLPSSGNAEVSPAFDSNWNASSSATRLKAVTTKISSTMTTAKSPYTAYGDYYNCLKQYVSDPIDAQTISAQTIKHQIRAYETNAKSDQLTAISVRVVSNDGSTVRGTVLSLVGDTLEVNSSLQNRGISGTSTQVVAQSGDRIVIEIGHHCNPWGNGTGDDFYHSIGDNSASDLPENDTETAAYNPWVEFANTITFQAANNDIVAKDLTGGIPVIDKPELVQNALVSTDLTAGVPVLDKPTLDQPVDNDLIAVDLTAGVPVLDKPHLGFILFSDGFEDGTTNSWDSVGGTPDINSAYALAGSAYGMNSDDNEYVVKDWGAIGNLVTSIRFRFYVDWTNLVNSRTADEWSYFPRIRQNYDGHVVGWYLYGIYRSDGTIDFAFVSSDDTNAVNNLGVYLNAEDYTKEVCIEVLLTRETYDGANDGSMEVWVDGSSVGSISTIDNYNMFPTLHGAYFGNYGVIPTDVAGTFHWDEFVIRDDGLEIGEKPNQLVSQDITAAPPTIDQPTLDQPGQNALTADDIFGGTPTLEKPDIGSIQNIVSQDLIGAPPVIDQPDLALTQAISADDLFGSPPVIDQPIIGHPPFDIVSDDIFAGVPTIDKPTLGQPGQNELTADDLFGGIPVIDKPDIGLIQNIVSDDITSGVPTIDKPSIEIAQAIIAKDLTAAPPTIDQPDIGSIQDITAVDIMGSPPVIDKPTLEQIQSLEAIDITAGIPVIDDPVLAQLFGLTARDIFAGVPVIDKPSMDAVDPVYLGLPTRPGLKMLLPTIERPLPSRNTEMQLPSRKGKNQ